MGKFLFLLLSAILLCASHSFSQDKVKGSVKGVLADTASGRQNLSDATVSITPLGKDSSEAEYTVSDKKGGFSFKGLSPGSYKLLITFLGYQHISKTISISAANKDIDLATLYMQRMGDLMQEVVVQRPPMSIKKDTVEYNAGMYTTKPNAVAEDLLKKFPGVQVDQNGNITAQGETVSRILVNGKRFFSDDPKLATRNLPPDIIDKIQVFDDLSDQSKFTGFDDGNRVKTINIITRKDKRQGYFGRTVAGVGTDENYDESINMHRFDGDQQISLLGQANDVNKQNFTPQDIFGSSGGGGRRGGGGGGGNGGGGGSSGQSSSGVTTVWAAGANYRNSFGPRTDLYGSYFFNSQHVSVNSTDSIIKPVTGGAADSTWTTTGGSSSISKIQNHRIYMNLEERFDSNNSLVFRPNITFQTSTPHSSSYSSTYDNKGLPVNSSVGYASSYNTGFTINSSNLQLRHKFQKPFRTISLDLNTTANINNGYGNNYAVNNLYKINSLDTLNQYYNDSLHALTISPTLSYTEPVGKNQIVELNYNYSYTRNTTINNTYDFVDSVHGYKQFDSLFSNSYRFTSNSNRFTLNYRIQNPKYNVSVGSGIQFMDFNSLNTTKNITVAHNYVNLTPTVNFQYLFSRTQHLRLNYSGRTGTPSPAQLQPLTTTSDQISYQFGNPGLKPQFTHSLRLLYASFDPGSQKVMFATINASTTLNDIQSAMYYNPRGGTNSTYVNLNGTYNVSGYFNYGFPLKKPKSNLNFITNVNYSQSQTLSAIDSIAASQNDFQHIYTKNTSMGETISWTTNLKKNFDMNFSSASTYFIARRTPPAFQKSGVDTAKSSNANNNNLNYFTEVLSAEITAYTNNGWLIATTFSFSYTNNNSSAYNASVPLLSPSIAKSIFKKKNGELRLTVFDLLNQNTSVSKTVTSQTSYTRTNVLTRYAMLTFTWNLNNFAGSNQRRMPGMFPGRFRGGGGGGGGFGGPGGGPGGPGEF